MKKRICMAGALILLLVWLCVGTVFAEDVPTVTYNGASGTFSFHMTEDGLFGDFQGLMPGDERKTEIRVEMKNLSGPARLYLRAVPEAGDLSVLEPLTLRVVQNGALVSQGSGVNTLDKDVLLGSFSGSGSTTLEVTLMVPVTVGNELARQMGRVQWIFTVQKEGGDTHPSEPVGPETGDAGIGLYCVMALAVMAGIFVLRKKKCTAHIK